MCPTKFLGILKCLSTVHQEAEQKFFFLFDNWEDDKFEVLNIFT